MFVFFPSPPPPPPASPSPLHLLLLPVNHKSFPQYVAYGHSLIVSPKGEIVSSPTPENEGECLVRARLEPEVMRSQREGLPLWRVSRLLVCRASEHSVLKVS